MVRHVPNFITILNLVTGCFAVYFAFSGNPAFAGWLIGLAAVFDFLDGLAARMLRSVSPIGKILDSLADVISFGLAPAAIMLDLISERSGSASFLPFVAFIIPAFSALRLAVFSVDDQQKEQFQGVPTPANALFLASFPLIIGHFPGSSLVNTMFTSLYFLVGVTVISSFLLVLKVPILSLKFSDFSWRYNQPRYLLIGSSIALLIWLNFLAVPVIFVLYILISVFFLRKH